MPLIIKAPPRGMLWSPAFERGRRLQAWYDAADARTAVRVYNAGAPTLSVDGWRDRSGLGRLVEADGAQRPRWNVRQLNGLPVMSQDGQGGQSMGVVQDGGVLNVYNVGAMGFCVVSVFRIWSYVNGGNDGAGTYVWDRGGTGTSLGKPLWSMKVINNNVSIQYRNNAEQWLGGWQMFPVTIGKAELSSTRYLTGNQYPILTWRDGAFYNGTSADFGNIHPDAIRFSYGAATASASDVDMAEWMCFNDATDSVLRRRAEGYLAHKWGIPLSKDHPYATRPPMAAAR